MYGVAHFLYGVALSDSVINVSPSHAKVFKAVCSHSELIMQNKVNAPISSDPHTSSSERPEFLIHEKK